MAVTTDIRTMACSHGMHPSCNRDDQQCMCGCHPWNVRPKGLLETYREEAHAAVKAFDHKPSPETASAAMAALSLFIGVHSA